MILIAASKYKASTESGSVYEIYFLFCVCFYELYKLSSVFLEFNNFLPWYVFKIQYRK